MPTAYLDTWNPLAIVAAHQQLVALLDAGTEPARVTLHSDDDTLLGTVLLTNPCGTVNGTTGRLTLTKADTGLGLENATIAYASIRDGDGVVFRSLPCVVGSASVPGYCVVNTLICEEGKILDILSLVVT